MANEGTYLRVNPVTKTAVTLIANELGMQKGKKLSVDAALWEFIKSCRPDITERAADLSKGQKDNNKPSG